MRKDLKLAESVFIEVSKNIFTKNRNIILGVIYRSPDSQLSMFNESLENILIQIDNEKCIAYLSGDFNVNTAEVLSCKSQTIHDFINIYSSFHYHKLINQPTRIILHKNSIKTATLIDNIYTNSTNWETSTNGILHSDLIIGTDHKTIFTIIPNTDIPNPPIYRTQRDLSIKNVTKLKKSYTKKNWTDLYMIKSIHETFTYFIGFITQTFYDCCPEEKNNKNKI